MANFFRPTFSTALFGYSKRAVNDFITRLESEMDIAAAQQESRAKEITALREASEQASNLVESMRLECDNLRTRNDLLNANLRELEIRLQNEQDEKARLSREVQKLKDKITELGTDPDLVAAALLSAQRMSVTIIKEANQKSEEIHQQAEADLASTQERMDNLVTEKQAEMDEIVQAAEEKRDGLNKQYDEALGTISSFKAKLYSLFRQHLALLDAMPDNGTVAPFAQTELPPEEEEEDETDCAENPESDSRLRLV